MGRLDLRDKHRDEDEQPETFARGGVIRSTGWALVGERGPESIIPLRRPPENTARPGAPETK